MSYHILHAGNIQNYLYEHSIIRDYFKYSELLVKDISSGALNSVYWVCAADDKNISLVLKQALPYIRSKGESFPLTIERMHYEIRAYQEYSKHTPSLVPRIYHEDEAMSVIVMEDLKTHNLLKSGLMRSVIYPELADHISSFLSNNLFKTSSLYLLSQQKRALVDRFNKNSQLCRWTENVFFYFTKESACNRSFLGEELYQEVHFNAVLTQKNIMLLKYKFMTQSDALLHGDFCGGAIMADEHETFVIDPEFSFVGPFGYDIGSIISTLVVFYVAHKIYDSNSRYAEWIIETIEKTYLLFEKKFMRLWSEQKESSLGSHEEMDENALNMFKQQFMENMLNDSVGFAGVKIYFRLNVHMPALVENNGSLQEYRANDSIFQKTMADIAKIFLNHREAMKSIHDVLKIIGTIRFNK